MSFDAPEMKIEVTKDGSTFRVDWDYQTDAAFTALKLKSPYLNGYLQGAVAALAVDKARVLCCTPYTGTVKGLTKEAAMRLEFLLKESVGTICEQNASPQKDLLAC